MREKRNPVLTAAGMQAADRRTIDSFGLPGFTLMETAGRKTVDAIIRRYGNPGGKTFGIVCGSGNNGGDGLVIARVLAANGAQVHVFLVGDVGRMTPDAEKNLALYRQLVENDRSNFLHLHVGQEACSVVEFCGISVWVDAMLGTGLSSNLREPYLRIVNDLNSLPAPVVAVDIPTGLSATTGEVLGTAIRADMTVTMAALKMGHLVGEGPEKSGSVHVAEIGIPGHFLDDQVHQNNGAWQPTESWFRSVVPNRHRAAHKYDVGYLLVIAGSEGLTGAATMATTAAERAGAGGVVCAVPASVQSTMAVKLTSAMPFGLGESTNGGIDTSALEQLQPHIKKASGILIGCGLGRQSTTLAFVREMITETSLPIVVDADGLFACIGHVERIGKQRKGNWILTPHWGEFLRLAENDDIQKYSRIDLVRKYAIKWNAVLLLKGAPGIIGAPDGSVSINPTGNAAAATAGSGDVLAGIIAGLLAQGLTPVEATVAGLFAAGSSLDRLSRSRFDNSIVATDIIEELPRTLGSIMNQKQ